jgi:hypothetical protein
MVFIGFLSGKLRTVDVFQAAGGHNVSRDLLVDGSVPTAHGNDGNST